MSDLPDPAQEIRDLRRERDAAQEEVERLQEVLRAILSFGDPRRIHSKAKDALDGGGDAADD